MNDLQIAPLHWLKRYGGFYGPGQKVVPPRYKCMSWRTNLLCIVVELAEGGSAINGDTLSSLLSILYDSRIFSKSRCHFFPAGWQGLCVCCFLI